MKKPLLLFAAIMMAGTGLWAETVVYVDAAGQEETADAAIVTSSDDLVTWGVAGETTWYAVTDANVQLKQGAVCIGDVRLILADGAGTLLDVYNENGVGIEVSGAGNSLTIYGQTEQSGQLTVTGQRGAGIGGGRKQEGSHITINGGMVTAIGRGGAGIGGGDRGNGHDITINGGTVTATSGTLGAGIGGGDQGAGYYITINGGTVTATGAAHAAGIGGGEGDEVDEDVGAGHDITINGGTVTATAGEGAAGIGGGYYSNGTDITIAGGIVTANGGEGAAGIGAGRGVEESNRGIRDGHDIYLLGGIVTANGGDGGDGIGCGWYGRSFFIYADPCVIVKAGTSENPAAEIATRRADRIEISYSLSGKRYATTTQTASLAANQDPDSKRSYYATFYSSQYAHAVPEGVTAYTGVADGSVLTLTPIEDDIIPADEAVILRLTTDDNTAPTQEIVLTATAAAATTSTDNMLLGSDAAMTLPQNSYALSLGQHGVGFYDFSGYELPANKAYLTLAAGSSSGLRFSFGDATDIDDPVITTPAPAYNLQGQQVDENYRGIVIINGKKYVAK